MSKSFHHSPEFRSAKLERKGARREPFSKTDEGQDRRRQRKAARAIKELYLTQRAL